ncbi:MAG: AGE family epimerase/isomerase, partial [Spirochaetota bacterium]
NRPVKAMGFPMMQVWMAEEMQGLVPQSELDATVDAAVDQFFSIHVDRERKAVFERVFADGTRPDCMEGRLLTPGHALETLWFIMRVADGRGDAGLVERCREAMIWTVERGWDAEYGGIYYYQDFEGRPTDKIEAGMKLWWVHAEALCAFLLAYRLTGDPSCEAWFRKIHDYSWERFRDPEFGEWYGYLDRRGDVALTLKGGKWKGLFHIPRALLECRNWFEIMERECPAEGKYTPGEPRP